MRSVEQTVPLLEGDGVVGAGLGAGAAAGTQFFIHPGYRLAAGSRTLADKTQRTCGDAVALKSGFVHVRGEVSGPRHVHAPVNVLAGAQPHAVVREEPVGVLRDAEQRGHGRSVLLRYQRRRQHQQIARHDSPIRQRQPLIGHSGRTVGCVVDEKNPLLLGQADGFLARFAVGQQVAVDDRHVGLRMSRPDRLCLAHGRHAADTGTVGYLVIPLTGAQ